MTAPARRSAPARAPREAPRPHLRVVERRARRPRRGVLVVAAMAIVFAALLASAVFHALLAQGQQRLDHTQQEVSDAQQRYDDLRLELDRLSAPDRIVRDAEKQGMVTPDNVETITPAPGTGASVQGTDAAGAGAPANTRTGYPTVKPYLGADR